MFTDYIAILRGGITEWNDKSDERVDTGSGQTRQGDFDEIYLLYAPQVYRYVRSRVPNDEDAADLTQQVFAQALGALPQYDARGSPFVAWLIRIARNVAADYYRRRPSTTNWDRRAETLQSAEERPVENTVVRNEEMERLHKALCMLSPDKRELLALRFGADLTGKEIAAIVGRSEAAIYKQLARIVAVLREQNGDGNPLT